jgi:hypothetical protein
MTTLGMGELQMTQAKCWTFDEQESEKKARVRSVGGYLALGGPQIRLAAL